MLLSIIVAMDEQNTIGINNTLPWRLPSDLKRLKAITMGKPIIMGRKTYDSIGRPLPGRHNIVLTRDPSFSPEGVTVVNNPEAALEAVASDNEAIVFGGANIYQVFLPKVQRIYLTRVHTKVTGDSFFPSLEGAEWQLVEEEAHLANDKDEFDFTYQTLERTP